MHITDQLQKAQEVLRDKPDAALVEAVNDGDAAKERRDYTASMIASREVFAQAAMVEIARREQQRRAAQSAAYQSAIACADSAFNAWKFSETSDQSDLNAFAGTTARAIESAVRAIQ